MPNDWFRFKQFNINQSHCAMKVGTDGVLLGAWTRCENTGHVLDVGTGTGLIALMIAQRSEAFIDAVETDKNAAAQATENVAESPWASRINIYCEKFQDFVRQGKRSYDLIVSNPPFYPEQSLPPKRLRSMAKHTADLSWSDLCLLGPAVLDPRGRIALILPVQEGEYCIEYAISHGLYMNRIMRVRPNRLKEWHRLLLELSMVPGETEESELCLEEEARHHFSMEYRELTKDFYLKF